jgi:hypothetical protein
MQLTTCYLGLVIEVCLKHWFPVSYENTHVDYLKVQPIQEWKKKKTIDEQLQSLKVVMKE